MSAKKPVADKPKAKKPAPRKAAVTPVRKQAPPLEESVNEFGLTVKQEAYACHYVELGGKGSEAYRRAYDAGSMSDKTIWEAASRLLKNSKVAARIKQLREVIAEACKLTVSDLLQELEEARALAAKAETAQTGAMVSATMGKAKLLGLLSDKVLHGVIPEDPLSDFLKTIQGSALMPVAKPKEGLDDAE